MSRFLHMGNFKEKILSRMGMRTPDWTTPLMQSGARWWPGRECFTPWRIYVAMSLYGELHKWISWVQGVSGHQTREPPFQYYAIILTWNRLRRVIIMLLYISSYGELRERYLESKGVRAYRLEDPPSANLAPPGDLEGSASHHKIKQEMRRDQAKHQRPLKSHARQCQISTKR